jgi:hypothetical protein
MGTDKEALKRELEMVTVERDALRKECAMLYGKLEEEKRKTELANAALQTRTRGLGAVDSARQHVNAERDGEISRFDPEVESLFRQLNHADAGLQAEKGEHARAPEATYRCWPRRYHLSDFEGIWESPRTDRTVTELLEDLPCCDEDNCHCSEGLNLRQDGASPDRRGQERLVDEVPCVSGEDSKSYCSTE